MEPFCCLTRPTTVTVPPTCCTHGHGVGSTSGGRGEAGIGPGASQKPSRQDKAAAQRTEHGGCAPQTRRAHACVRDTIFCVPRGRRHDAWPHITQALGRAGGHLSKGQAVDARRAAALGLQIVWQRQLGPESYIARVPIVPSSGAPAQQGMKPPAAPQLGAHLSPWDGLLFLLLTETRAKAPRAVGISLSPFGFRARLCWRWQKLFSISTPTPFPAEPEA